MTSFVLCVQDKLNQCKSQAFSLLKQSLIMRSHQTQVLLRCIQKRDLRDLQHAMRRWQKQAWAMKGECIAREYLYRDRTRAMVSLLTKAEARLQRKGFAGWRKKAGALTLERRLI